jgi:hypothetical protein
MLGELVTSKVYKETQPMIAKKVFSEFLSSSTEQEVKYNKSSYTVCF